jgi:hypothetical protein
MRGRGGEKRDGFALIVGLTATWRNPQGACRTSSWSFRRWTSSSSSSP